MGLRRHGDVGRLPARLAFKNAPHGVLILWRAGLQPRLHRQPVRLRLLRLARQRLALRQLRALHFHLCLLLESRRLQPLRPIHVELHRAHTARLLLRRLRRALPLRGNRCSHAALPRRHLALDVGNVIRIAATIVGTQRNRSMVRVAQVGCAEMPPLVDEVAQGEIDVSRRVGALVRVHRRHAVTGIARRRRLDLPKPHRLPAIANRVRVSAALLLEQAQRQIQRHAVFLRDGRHKAHKIG